MLQTINIVVNSGRTTLNVDKVWTLLYERRWSAKLLPTEISDNPEGLWVVNKDAALNLSNLAIKEIVRLVVTLSKLLYLGSSRQKLQSGTLGTWIWAFTGFPKTSFEMNFIVAKNLVNGVRDSESPIVGTPNFR